MIVTALTNAFLLDLLARTMQDVFRIALYTDAASLGPGTPTYTTVGEAQGQGYKAGGQVLTGCLCDCQPGEAAWMTWANPVWPKSSIVARGALIYNASRGNKAVASLDLGKNFTSTDGDFLVKLPPPGAATALIAIGD